MRRLGKPWVGAACVLLAFWGAGCSRLPDNSQRTESFAFTDTQDAPLGRMFADAVSQHPGHSGLHPMPNGVDAFAARTTLADLAQRSLDVQYYIWDPDPIGRLLI
jgi:cardiolipin synthase C